MNIAGYIIALKKISDLLQRPIFKQVVGAEPIEHLSRCQPESFVYGVTLAMVFLRQPFKNQPGKYLVID